MAVTHHHGNVFVSIVFRSMLVSISSVTTGRSHAHLSKDLWSSRKRNKDKNRSTKKKTKTKKQKQIADMSIVKATEWTAPQAPPLRLRPCSFWTDDFGTNVVADVNVSELIGEIVAQRLDSVEKYNEAI